MSIQSDRELQKKLIKYSRNLCYILRHKPDSIGLQLDDQGWVGVEDLISATTETDYPLTEELLSEIVISDDKQRFALSKDGLKIRASQGHSVDVNLGLKPSRPPELLYHGTTDRSLKSILSNGLQKQQRMHVHLSTTREQAKTVGKRHGRPVILEVRAQVMGNEGYQFYLSDNGVWLTDHVPSEYIDEQI